MNFFECSSQVTCLQHILCFLWLRCVFLCTCASIYYKAPTIDAEAVQRAATIAEAEGVGKIEATHLERVLPQLLLDF